MYNRFKEFVLLHKLEVGIGCVAVYFVVGCIGNIYASPLVEPTPKVAYVLGSPFLLLWYGAIFFSIFGLGRSIEQWGFTLNDKSLYSIGLGMVILLLVGVNYGIIIPPKSTLDFVIGVFAASAEELHLRVLYLLLFY
ncbi:MAG: hypothetical protein MUO85_02685 [candidate division Zixibacteria bacterium]|nr:hypothetical protein [candidate division Zixibacteria bacterium]